MNLNNKRALILSFFFTLKIFSQATIENGKIELKLKKGKTISKKIQNHTFIRANSKEIKTVMVKVDMLSLTRKRETIDFNKFYLIDEKSKSRIKLIDASKKDFTAYVGIQKLIDVKTIPKRKKNYYYSYDPSITDKFYDYKREGYQDIVFSINFGTNKKPNNKVIYYKPLKFRKKRLILFFPFPKNSNNASLYYGKAKITDFKVK